MVRASAFIVLLLCSCATDRPAATPQPATAGPGQAVAPQAAPSTPAVAPAAPPQPPGPFIVLFDRDKDELTPQAAAILDEAARYYRATGHTIVRLESAGSADDPGLALQRVTAAKTYLARRGVWARAVTPGGDGNWEPWSAAAGPGSDGPVLLLGPRPLSTLPPKPDPPPAPPSPPRPPRGARLPAGSAGMDMPQATGSIVRPAPSMSALRTWLTPTGTLSAQALAAMKAECVRLEGELTAECQSAAVAGVGGFGAAPKDARDEFSFLLDSCRGAAPGESCAEIIGLEREFRALRRGRLDPQPRTMREDERTRFTAFIIEEGDPRRGGGPGRPIGGEAGDGKAAGGEIVIPFSRRMCFGLTADATDFRIEPVGDPCMTILAGGGRVKFNPQWDVTPLRAGTLELRLVTELFVNDEKREFRHEPYPLLIDVKAKPSLWDRIDNAIKRATGTVNLAVGLAEALGTLFTVIAGWAIWSWFKRRRRAGRPAAKKKGK